MTDVVANPVERFEERADGQFQWLRDNHPNVFDEQKHLDAGTPERAYWHYGYAAALRDVVESLKRGSEQKQ